uniref:hypothetical protein n=1 Tax=Xanthomonas graminis TaxID=3390026 RepID=UPI000B2023CA
MRGEFIRGLDVASSRARGLKQTASTSVIGIIGVASSRARGLKRPLGEAGDDGVYGRVLTGAWIETLEDGDGLILPLVASSRARGLKLGFRDLRGRLVLVASSRARGLKRLLRAGRFAVHGSRPHGRVD